MTNELGQLLGWNDGAVSWKVDVTFDIGRMDDRGDLRGAVRIGICVDVRGQAEMLGVLEAFGGWNVSEDHSVRKDLGSDLDLILTPELKEFFVEHASDDQLIFGCWPFVFRRLRISLRGNLYIAKEPFRCWLIAWLFHLTSLVE